MAKEVHMRVRPPGAPPALRAGPLAIAAAACCAAACSQAGLAPLPPVLDLRPPGLLAAGPSGARSFEARFDEPVLLVDGSLALEPRAPISGAANGADLRVDFGEDQSPGLDYRLAGEVDDSRGNRTRFLVRFTGWNGRPAAMRVSELQTGKNGSQSRPHRDYVELEVLEDGNVGGEELAWSSSVKSMSYRFPGIEVRKGDFIVLHLSPEGLGAEVDELGPDVSASGGVDSSAAGRDLWCDSGALPDESGALCLRSRPGGAPAEGLFYAREDKSGPLGEDKLSALVSELAGAGAWPIAGAAPSWSDAFRWNPSSARSICRSAPAIGASAWYVTAAGGQSPGSPNPGPASASSASTTSKSSRKKIK
jgi:hypothetical protein